MAKSTVSAKEEFQELAVSYWGRVGDEERWLCACCETKESFVHGTDAPRNPLDEGWIMIHRTVPPYRKSLLICPECQKAIREPRTWQKEHCND